MPEATATTAPLPADHPCRTACDPVFVVEATDAREDLYECRLCKRLIVRPWDRPAYPMRAYDAHDSEDYLRADGEAEQREGRWR